MLGLLTLSSSSPFLSTQSPSAPHLILPRDSATQTAGIVHSIWFKAWHAQNRTGEE